MGVACIEIGGSGVETVLLADDGTHRRAEGAVISLDDRVLVAVPGIVEAGRVVIASNLGWVDVDPLDALGVHGTADLVLNDAEAAALGEVALRHRQGVHSAVHLGLGTGIGGAVVVDDRIVGGNLFGHQPGFSEQTCGCGRVGCLETIAAGWALPDPLDDREVARLADGLARAIEAERLATPPLVVVAGGLARRYPQVVDELAIRLPHRHVEPSAAPRDVKSAAAWGLRMVDDLVRAGERT